MSPARDIDTLEGALDFWFNGTSHSTWKGVGPGHVEYTGGHSTSRDPALRKGLANVIKRLDKEYFEGEITWADSVLPC